MPIFEVEANGRQFEVDAPSIEAATAAISKFAPPAEASGKGSTQAVEGPGLGTRIRDMFTGELRTEFPDAPEFGAALTQAATAAGKGTPAPLGMLTSLVTPDPQAQLDILTKQLPGLESTKDAYGNIMVRLPSEGVTEFTYLNKPGLSSRDAGEFLVQTLPTLPFSPLFGAGRSIATRIATGAAAGAGGSVAQDAAATAAGSDQGIDAGRAAISSLFGGAMGPLLGRQATAAAPAPNQGLLDAAERINVTVPRAVASDSRAVQSMAGATRMLPFASHLQEAAETMTSQIGQAADDVATRFGGGTTQTPFSAGSTARESLVDWIKRGSKVEMSQGYDALDSLIKPDTMVPLSRTQIAAKALDSLDVMSATNDGQRVIGLVREAISRPGGLSYEGLKELRTRVGERVFGDIAPEQGTSARALNRIYDALTEDLRFGVQRAGIAKRGSSGKKALEAFDAATAEAKRLFDIRDKLKTIVGTEGDASAERVFDRLIQMSGTRGNADIAKLQLARDAIQKAGPGTWEEVASALIARVGRDKNGEFSPARFLTEYGKLDDKAKQVLFGGNVGVHQALEDIAAVSRRYEDTVSRFANPSGTGRAVTSVAGIVGAVAAPMETLLSAVGGYALAYYLSRPATAKAISRWSNAYLQAATKESQATVTLLNQASRQLAEAMDQEDAAQDGRRQ